LRLLFELSQSPTNVKYIPNQDTQSIITKKELTWKRILQEEPLLGEHWKETPLINSESEPESIKEESVLVEVSYDVSLDHHY
jgi:hypothetical protein